MAILTAHQRVDMLGTLDLEIAEPGNATLNFPPVEVKYGSGTTALDLHSGLANLVFAGGEMISGTIDALEETKGGKPSYELSGVDFKLEDLFAAETGNYVAAFAATLFSGRDVITGSKQGDALYGFGGDDTIEGGKGADVLSGGQGHDKLTGGKGGDQFRFDTAPDPASVDRITDFKHGKDTLGFDPVTFAPLVSGSGGVKGAFFHVGKQAADSNDFLIYNDHNGKLFYDHDGNGSDPEIEIAKLDHHPNLTSHDLELFL